MKRFVSILFAILAIASCKSRSTIADKNYDFGKVERLVVLSVSDFRGVSGSGKLIQNRTSEYLVRLGAEVIARDQSTSYTGELEALQSLNDLELSAETALLEVTIAEYRLQTREQVPVETVDHGGTETTVLRQVHVTCKLGSQLVECDKVPNASLHKVEKVLAEKTVKKNMRGRTMKTFRIETIFASVSLSAKMVDIATGKTVWLSSSHGSANNILRASRNSVAELLEPLKELLKRRATRSTRVASRSD